MTRKRQEAIRSAVKSVFEEIHATHNTAFASAPAPARRTHKYNLRPRKSVSYVERNDMNECEYYSDFFYADDAKDLDYVPYVHVSSSNKPTQLPPSLPNTSASLSNNISYFIAEVNASSLNNDTPYSQMGQSTAGVSHRWALRSSVKK